MQFINIHATLYILIAMFYLVPTATRGQESIDVRVMSFNIRFGTARDGVNHWDRRKENVVTTISDFQPDVVGTQEVLPFQADFLSKNLEGFEYVGRSRDNSKSGEQCGILIRSSRFDILEQGHFWLSEAPNWPGSKSWDSSLPRMASWLKLFDRRSKSVFYFVNTHFDHRGKIAREKSSQVIVDRSKRFEAGLPIIITGDFNSGAGTVPYQVISEVYVDTFDKLHPDAKETGTFSGFDGRTDGARIDCIFVSRKVKVVEAGIDRREFDRRNPSDHFPVTSVLRFAK